MSARHLLLELFDAALRAVDGRACVARALRAAAPAGPVELFAIGKAASAMTLGARDVLGERLRAGLVITKDGHDDPALSGDPRIASYLAAHPVPDARSLAAGAELERRVRALDAGVFPVFLVSGGSSSLVESLRPGASLEKLRELNEHGLAAGWDIARLNRERAARSSIKGGGLCALLAGRPALALFISDVPDDDPAVIGSGLLGPGGVDDRVERRIVASVDVAVRAVVDAAAARGLVLDAGARRFDGEARAVAADFVAALRDAHGDGLVWGGESTVSLPSQPGRGGRNTHLALAAALELRAADPLTILAAGTDGTDGPTGDAGAIVDAGTRDRAEIAGVDVAHAFATCDSGTALEAAGDLVHTGPTGTNVGDLLIGLGRSATPVRDAARGRML